MARISIPGETNDRLSTADVRISNKAHNGYNKQPRAFVNLQHRLSIVGNLQISQTNVAIGPLNLYPKEAVGGENMEAVFFMVEHVVLSADVEL